MYRSRKTWLLKTHTTYECAYSTYVLLKVHQGSVTLMMSCEPTVMRPLRAPRQRLGRIPSFLLCRRPFCSLESCFTVRVCWCFGTGSDGIGPHQDVLVNISSKRAKSQRPVYKAVGPMSAASSITSGRYFNSYF